MALYLNNKIKPFLKAYLEQYSTMVDMLEGIDNKVAAEAYAVSVALQGRMVREQMNNIARMEKKYGDWIPGFERHFHDGLEKMRKKAEDERKRAFRALLKLTTARMYDSPSMQKAVEGFKIEQPRLIDFRSSGPILSRPWKSSACAWRELTFSCAASRMPERLTSAPWSWWKWWPS